jgi:hypothetical protein
MLCKNNIGVLDKGVTLIPCIWINKDGKIRANIHFYKTISQKHRLPDSKSAAKSR